MSYARWGEDSDVYAYDAGSVLVCCWCRLLRHDDNGPEPDFECNTPLGMIKHLKEHKALGHKVPDEALERLEKEAIRDGSMIVMEVKV
jgi:hypothetical protein